MYCSMLQMLQCLAMDAICEALVRVAQCCGMVQGVSACRSVVQRSVVRSKCRYVMQRGAVRGSVLQYVAVCCSVLQCVAVCKPFWRRQG